MRLSITLDQTEELLDCGDWMLFNCVACLLGALLAEGIKPSDKWRSTFINIILGLSFGAFGPQGIEMWWARFDKAHRLSTFFCALAGSMVCRSFLDWLNGKKLSEILDALLRTGKPLRPPETPPSGDK